MVLYHPNGRVVLAHEHYLEQEARNNADGHGYIDQIDVYNQRTANVSTANIHIIIDAQEYTTLYCEREGEWETLEAFKQKTPHRISQTVARRTLMRYSTFAQEYFTYNPGEHKLHLPVRYPRRHNSGYVADVDGKKFADQSHSQMAFIRPDELVNYVIPWLVKVQNQFERSTTPRDGVNKDKNTGTPKKTRLTHHLAREGDPIAMQIPEELVKKIHLYNAMLQLGLPKFVQLPLIDALVLQMYQTELNACHLSTLEHTIGRFYSRGVAILDPVLNHLIGTYSLRKLGDRTNTKPLTENGSESLEDMEDSVEQSEGARDDDEEKTAEDQDPQFDFKAANRGYVDYISIPAYRVNFPDDRYLLPPELPVIGHSIRHWSGVRRNGSTAAAHTGFPLNIGKYKKFIRRNSTAAINAEDYFEEETNRLARQPYYEKHGPGEVNQ
jgi:hypothetical protein